MGFFDKITSAAVSAAESAANTAKGVADTVTEKAKTATDTVSETAKSASETIADKTKEAWTGTVASAEEVSKWAETVPETIHTYADRFDADEMWDKITSTAAKVGQEMIIMVLTMYYTIEEALKNIDLKGIKNGKGK